MGSDGLESAGSPGLVQLYTLRTHTVVRTLTFTSRVLSVRASPRLLIVALDAQACTPTHPPSHLVLHVFRLNWNMSLLDL